MKAWQYTRSLPWPPDAHVFPSTSAMSLPHAQAPGLLGHLLQGDATAESKVTEVQKGHAQALVLKVVDLLLTRQLPQRCHIIHKLVLALGVGKLDWEGGPKTCSLLSFWPLWEGKGDFSFSAKANYTACMPPMTMPVADITNRSQHSFPCNPKTLRTLWFT